MRIEIWSDIVCPFCTIGKRRFEKALERFEHAGEVEVQWRSFELNPGAEASFEGTLDQWLAEKKGIPLAQAAAMNDQVAAMAAQEGLDFRLHQARPANTFDAHRLTHMAASEGLRTEVTAALFQAYFQDGEDIAEASTLRRIGSAAGLDGEAVAAMLREDGFAEAVRAEEERAYGLGIHAVPFFLIEGQYGISGAQSTERFLEALRQVHGLLAQGS